MSRSGTCNNHPADIFPQNLGLQLTLGRRSFRGLQVLPEVGGDLGLPGAAATGPGQVEGGGEGNLGGC